MRRVLAALACVVFAVAFAAIEVQVWHPFNADAVQMRERAVQWTKVKDWSPRDSAYVLRGTGLFNSAQQIDTTEWIPLWDEISPPNGAWLAADSITAVFSVTSEPSIGTATGVAIAADTIQVAIQASMEGVNPVAVTTSMGLTFQQLETSSNNAVYRVVSIGRAWAADGTAPTTLQLLPYRFIRFLVTGDHQGPYTAHWQYPGTDKYSPDRPHH